jgi:hypothetical protein
LNFNQFVDILIHSFFVSFRHMIHVILCHLWTCVSFDICVILHSFPSFCCIPLRKISLISNIDWCKNLLVCCKFKFHSWRGVFDTTIGDQVCQWLTSDLWFSLGTPVSSTNKTDWHDITEILLKVVNIARNSNMCRIELINGTNITTNPVND